VLVREPDALAAHVRFDEGSVETGTTARLFRHRQTKGAETDTPSLTFTAPHSYSTTALGVIACRVLLSGVVGYASLAHPTAALFIISGRSIPNRKIGRARHGRQRLTGAATEEGR
jgi:hypothetical protein